MQMCWRAGWAQTYPTKLIRFVVPSSPGGASDTVTRLVANALPQILGQRVVDAGVGGVSQPHWMPTEVDLDAHVYPISLPQGSGWRELAALVG